MRYTGVQNLSIIDIPCETGIQASMNINNRSDGVGRCHVCKKMKLLHNYLEKLFCGSCIEKYRDNIKFLEKNPLKCLLWINAYAQDPNPDTQLKTLAANNRLNNLGNTK